MHRKFSILGEQNWKENAKISLCDIRTNFFFLPQMNNLLSCQISERHSSKIFTEQKHSKYHLKFLNISGSVPACYSKCGSKSVAGFEYETLWVCESKTTAFKGHTMEIDPDANSFHNVLDSSWASNTISSSASRTVVLTSQPNSCYNNNKKDKIRKDHFK